MLFDTFSKGSIHVSHEPATFKYGFISEIYSLLFSSSSNCSKFGDQLNGRTVIDNMQDYYIVDQDKH